MVSISNAVRRITHIIPDQLYIKVRYYLKTGKRINLENPTTFNEKMQWLKLYDKNPIYTEMVDKYLVRQIISNIIGKEYLIPLIGVWDRVEDIDFSVLPNEFVLKCTHDSGGLVVCRDKSKLNIEEAKTKIQNSLKRNYYWHEREWPYKNVVPRIICEKYMENDGE